MECIRKNDGLLMIAKRSIELALLLMLAILVTSCTHVRRGDGPPPFHVDETKIPDAVPKPEPLSRNNLPVYRVKGKVYRTLKSSKNYQAVGIASWYGTLFHERRTSSGEPYNMLGMTAAHKTLPLPTYVEVLNLKNHRKVIVKVNDRGPFKDGRIIDLSYVAAKKLGMLGRGTTHVRVTAIDPYAFQKRLLLAKEKHSTVDDRAFTRRAPIQLASKKSRFLQVGTFKSHAHATTLKTRLAQKLGMPVLVTKNKQSRYLVEIGPFHSTQSETDMKKRLKKMRIMT